MSGVGSGNHYSRHVLQLEAVLKLKIKELSLLEEEQQLLKQKESQLYKAIQSIQGPLAVTKEVLGAALTADTPAAASVALRAQGLDLPPATSSTSQKGSESTTSTGDSRPRPSTAKPWPSSLPAAPYKDTAAMLQRLDQRETCVQQVLQQMGICDSEGYKQLYGTQLLRQAVQDPAAVASYVAMTREERLTFFFQTAAKMSLLLDKYDSDVGAAGAASPREQLEETLDHLLTCLVVCALWDAPGRYMSNIMFNMETHEFEPYPDGFWRMVAQAVDTTAQQKAAIKLTWERVKAQLQRLTQVYEQLQQRLQQLHRQQLQDNRQFEHIIKTLPALQRLQVTQRLRSKSQQQVTELQQAQELQQLHDGWQRQATPPPAAAAAAVDGGSDMAAGLLAAQLAAEPQTEVQDLMPQQQQQQQPWLRTQVASQGHPDGAHHPTAIGAAPSAAPVTAGSQGAPPATLTAGSARQQQGGAEVPGALPTVQQHSGVSPHGGASSSRSAAAAAEQLVMPQLDEAEEVLLQEGCMERQHIERCLQATMDKVKTMHFCQSLFLANTLSKKQLAMLFVHAYPYSPDAISFCEAMEQVGWD